MPHVSGRRRHRSQWPRAHHPWGSVARLHHIHRIRSTRPPLSDMPGPTVGLYLCAMRSGPGRRAPKFSFQRLTPAPREPAKSLTTSARASTHNSSLERTDVKDFAYPEQEHGRNLYGASCVKQFLVAGPNNGRGLRPSKRTSITAIAAGRRLDLGESIEVEIDDRLQRHRCGTFAEALGQRIEPCGTFGLDSEHFGEGVVPAPGPAPPVHRLAVFDHNPLAGVLAFGHDGAPGAQRCSGRARPPVRGLSACFSPPLRNALQMAPAGNPACPAQSR